MSGTARRGVATRQPATQPARAPAPAGKPITLPPYAVLLHNDDVNTMDHVVHALLASVPELAPEEAVQIMLTAHEEGVALVITCPLERAELYRERLEGRGLRATIERG